MSNTAGLTLVFIILGSKAACMVCVGLCQGLCRPQRLQRLLGLACCVSFLRSEWTGGESCGLGAHADRKDKSRQRGSLDFPLRKNPLHNLRCGAQRHVSYQPRLILESNQEEERALGFSKGNISVLSRFWQSGAFTMKVYRIGPEHVSSFLCPKMSDWNILFFTKNKGYFLCCLSACALLPRLSKMALRLSIEKSPYFYILTKTIGQSLPNFCHRSPQKNPLN